MKNLLALVKTKDDMTAYLAEKNPSAWCCKQKEPPEEETNTKILLHHVHAANMVNTTNNGAFSLRIHCSDTDVLDLAIIRRFLNLTRHLHSNSN